MRYGTTLLERFPRLGEVFVAGEVDFRVVAAAIFRTDLITDTDVLAKIDAELARKAPAWNKLSRDKITELVDWMVIDADPEAVRSFAVPRKGLCSNAVHPYHQYSSGRGGPTRTHSHQPTPSPTR